MPHMDDIRCKHCDALIALVPLAAVVGRFTLECQVCKVLRVVWPLQRPTLIVKEREYQPSQ